MLVFMISWISCLNMKKSKFSFLDRLEDSEWQFFTKFEDSVLKNVKMKRVTSFHQLMHEIMIFMKNMRGPDLPFLCKVYIYMRKVCANFEKNWKGRPFLITSHENEKIEFSWWFSKMAFSQIFFVDRLEGCEWRFLNEIW